MEEFGVHEGGRGYKIDEKDPGESAVQCAIEGGGIGPAAHRRRAHEKHDPNVFCIFSYILRRCMKNKRQSGETNEGRSRDEQGGGVVMGCGDGMNWIVDIVGIFGMVCWNGLYHELVGGGLDIYGGDLLGVMVNVFMCIYTIMKKTKSQRVFIDDGKPHPYARFLLRLVDVGLLGVYFLFFSILFAIGVEKLYNPLFGDHPSNTGVLVLEIALYAATVMILSYIIRHIVAMIPFPLDTLYGYNHGRVSELKGGVIFAFAIILFMNNFKKKIDMLVHDHLKLLWVNESLWKKYKHMMTSKENVSK